MNYYQDYLREQEKDPDSRPRSRRAAGIKRRNERAEVSATLAESSENTEDGFNPSFHASRHEREWILTYLGPFYNDHIITDVLRQVKGGKEATVYCCQADPVTGTELIAAKVYRPRMFRNLRNDALYREGRAVLNDQGKGVRGRREALAMHKRTDFGQGLLHTAWLVNEYETLRVLYDAGGDVPRPFAYNDNAILMEYCGEAGRPAALLHEVRLPPDEALPLFDRLMKNVALMLAHEQVHGDLSAHNVLYWEGTIKIIDFPQAVNALQNPHALELLTRDIERLCQYFARYGITANAPQIARDLWRRYILADNDAEPLVGTRSAL
jgi:RIO kinase 1